MELPADVRVLFDAANYAHLATVLPDGGPHTVPVWAGLEDGKIAFLTSPDSRKVRNLAADPRVAISVTDHDNPYAMGHLRGRVTARLDGPEAWAIIDRLSVKYTGQPYPLRSGRVVYLVGPKHPRPHLRVIRDACRPPAAADGEPMNMNDRALEAEEARLASASLAAGDPTGWFDRLYAAGAAGRVPVPWSRREPHPLLTDWAQRHHLAGAGKRAIVPGCGLGADAEYLAGLGFTTTGFDVSGTAIRLARERHPGSCVEYVCADLLHPPRAWRQAFDLVAEIITVQALPRAVRQRATTNVARLTAPGGTLLVIAAVHGGPGEQPGPPWPLTRAEVDAFAADGLTPAAIETTTMPSEPAERRWRAEFHRAP